MAKTDRFVLIEGPGGETFAVRESAFKRGADGKYKGFRITSYEGGEPYEGPKTSTQIARAESKTEPKSSKSDEPKAEG